jgi:hypothetical protein
MIVLRRLGGPIRLPPCVRRDLNLGNLDTACTLRVWLESSLTAETVG